MKSPKTVLAAGLAVALLAPISWGQQRPGGFQNRDGQPSNPLITALDINGDGEISAAELSKAVETLKKLDKNGDGQLTRDEIGSSGGFQPQGRRGGGGRSGGPGSAGSSRLSSAGLKIGSPLPDVTMFDSDGNEVPLTSLKGNYTVLVFGCLT